MGPPLRWALLLVAAALVPSCNLDSSNSVEHWLWVTVANDGVVSADVRSEAHYVYLLGEWDEHVNVSVDPNQSVKFGHDFAYLDRLTVRVLRSTDDVEIFHEVWSRSELRHLDRNVSIQVSP
jgi:hypothetical protein